MIGRWSYDEWCAADRRHGAPTFFARPAWARALCDTADGLEPCALRVGVDGSTAIVPVLRRLTRGLRFEEFIAFPLGGYTCVMNEDLTLASSDVAQRALARIAGEADLLRVILWPLGPQVPLPGAKRVVHETAAIDCSGGYERAIGNVRGVTRRMAGQAERRGAICARGDCEGDLDEYYDMLLEASAGWGLARPPISRELLRAVFARAGTDAELWFVSVDGTRIAGGVVLYGRDELFFWSAAMRRAYGMYRPSNALNLRLIGAACERSVRWYNLGASEGLDGVARFKRDLGARAFAYSTQSTQRPVYGVYERVRNVIVSRHGSAHAVNARTS